MRLAPGTRDYRGRDVRGAAVVWLGAEGPGGSAAPGGFDPAANRLLLNGRGRYAIEELRAAASIGVAPAGGAGRGGQNQAGAAPGARPRPQPDSAGRFHHGRTSRPPRSAAGDRHRRLLRVPVQPRSREVQRAEAQGRGARGAAEFRLDGVTLTFDVNTDYEVVRTQLTQNVVAIVEGIGSAAEADVRGVRRALRSRRLRRGRADEHGRRPAPLRRRRAASPRAPKPIASGTARTTTDRER